MARERLRTAHVVPRTCAVPATEVLASLWSEIHVGVRAGAREGGHHWVRGATSPDVTRWMECSKLFKGKMYRNTRSPVCGKWPNVITSTAVVEPGMRVKFSCSRRMKEMKGKEEADRKLTKYLNVSLNSFHFTHNRT